LEDWDSIKARAIRAIGYREALAILATSREHLGSIQKLKSSPYIYFINDKLCAEEHAWQYFDANLFMLDFKINMIEKSLEEVLKAIKKDAILQKNPESDIYPLTQIDEMHNVNMVKKLLDGTSEILTHVDIAITQRMEGQFQPPCHFPVFSLSTISGLSKIFTSVDCLAFYFMTLLDIKNANEHPPIISFSGVSNAKIFSQERVLSLRSNDRYLARVGLKLCHEICHLKTYEILESLRAIFFKCNDQNEFKSLLKDGLLYAFRGVEFYDIEKYIQDKSGSLNEFYKTIREEKVLFKGTQRKIQSEIPSYESLSIDGRNGEIDYNTLKLFGICIGSLPDLDRFMGLEDVPYTDRLNAFLLTSMKLIFPNMSYSLNEGKTFPRLEERSWAFVQKNIIQFREHTSDYFGSLLLGKSYLHQKSAFSNVGEKGFVNRYLMGMKVISEDDKEIFTKYSIPKFIEHLEGLILHLFKDGMLTNLLTSIIDSKLDDVKALPVDLIITEHKETAKDILDRLSESSEIEIMDEIFQLRFKYLENQHVVKLMEKHPIFDCLEPDLLLSSFMQSHINKIENSVNKSCGDDKNAWTYYKGEKKLTISILFSLINYFQNSQLCYYKVANALLGGLNNEC
jgi:hypothetical protein